MPTRIVIFSDVHANFEALRAIEGLVREADSAVCLGDIVGYYCEVNEALDFVRRYNVTCIRGNHDDFLLSGCPPEAPPAVRFGIEYADRVIASDHRRWLAGLPLTWSGYLAGSGAQRLSALLCHGSPWDPVGDYLYPDSPLLPQLRAFRYDVVAFGQTHRPFLDNRGRPVLLNPGAVGQSRHRPAVACAAVLDVSQTCRVDVREIPYDPTPVIRMAENAGAGAWIRKHLLSTGSDCRAGHEPIPRT